VSRRLHYLSRTTVEIRGSEGTAAETAVVGKPLKHRKLAQKPNTINYLDKPANSRSTPAASIRLSSWQAIRLSRMP
jgi:hypothetical protein